jgi:hypothetical protein
MSHNAASYAAPPIQPDDPAVAHDRPQDEGRGVGAALR